MSSIQQRGWQSKSDARSPRLAGIRGPFIGFAFTWCSMPLSNSLLCFLPNIEAPTGRHACRSSPSLDTKQIDVCQKNTSSCETCSTSVDQATKGDLQAAYPDSPPLSASCQSHDAALCPAAESLSQRAVAILTVRPGSPQGCAPLRTCVSTSPWRPAQLSGSPSCIDTACIMA